MEKNFFAPGRVNLIGEHIDYNGGYVFPCSLSMGTYGTMRLRTDRNIYLTSDNFATVCLTELDNPAHDPAHDWANYPRGIVREFLKLGHTLGGFDLHVRGDIPNGAGLSSSASLEMLTAVALNEMFGCGLSMLEMVLLARRAENQFMGVNCGIMDMYAVGFGKRDNALLLDCAGPTHEYVPLQLAGHKIVIANTNKRRGLNDSKYNERRAECDASLAILQKAVAIENLCDLDVPTFEKHAALLTDPILRNRTTHVVHENARTKAAVKSDLVTFGQLMNASHVSLRDLYEVTGSELDALAAAAWEAEGVLGSRMTGAGFGGCTVSLVRGDAVPAFIEKVGEKYTAATGLKADFYEAEIGDGAGVV